MKTLIKKFKKQFGYTPTNNEIISLYYQGALILTDKEEDAILEMIENN